MTDKPDLLDVHAAFVHGLKSALETVQSIQTASGVDVSRPEIIAVLGHCVETAEKVIENDTLVALTPRLTAYYTNYKGERSLRTIVPVSIWHGTTEWHPEKQWFLRAYDLDRNAYRDFAITDFG